MYNELDIKNKYVELIVTECARKLLLSERYIPLNDSCTGFIKNSNEIIFFDKNLYFENADDYSRQYKHVRFHHQSDSDLNYFKSSDLDIKYTTIIHPVITIDSNYLALQGRVRHTERKLRNRYSKMDITVEKRYRSIDDILDLLDYWDFNKRSTGTSMTFTGHDRSFFKRFLKDLRSKIKLYEYYFYHNGILLGYSIIEQVNSNFFISHSRKSRRYEYSGIDYYIDYYTYDDIHKSIGEDYLIEIGYEIGKLTTYKTEHFDIYTLVNGYNVTINNKEKKNAILF